MQRKAAIFWIGWIWILGILFLSRGTALANFYPEKIRNFDVDITVNKDGTLSFKESILYDFGDSLKHGIYRDIPVKGIKIEVLKVIDEQSNSYLFNISRQGKYLRIKIGDPNRLITGEHQYNIFYNVQNGIGYFKEHDELYWNVTGNEWQLPIEESSAIIHLPQRVSEKELKFECFTGVLGSKEKNCTFKLSEDGDIYFESQRSFNPREGLTIVLGWPKGIVEEPTIIQRLLWLLRDFWPIFIPIFAFIFLFREWWKKGKDPRLKKTIIAQYEPPDNLRPAEVNLIVRQRVQTTDISATLIDLAVRGYIKIKEIKKRNIFELVGPKKFDEKAEKMGFLKKIFSLLHFDDYEIESLKDFRVKNENLCEYEKDLLEKIFGSKEKVLLSSLKNKFYKNFPKILDKIYERVTSLKYFVSNPRKIIGKWVGIGIAIIFVGFFSLFFKPILGISFITSGILFLIFSKLMPKKTEKGARAYWYALGFKEYINTAEKYRLQFQEKENIFEKYLPYAIVFNIAEKWARAFEGIYNNPPSWYEGDFGPRFTAIAFTNSLNHSLSNMNNFLASRPGGGGSGFGGGSSGGGGGGGGGGRW